MKIVVINDDTAIRTSEIAVVTKHKVSLQLAVWMKNDMSKPIMITFDDVEQMENAWKVLCENIGVYND